MERIRSTLYRIAATLFDRPVPERTLRLRALVVSLLYQAPADAEWLETLAAIARELGHEQDLTAEHRRLFVLSSTRVQAQPFESYWIGGPVRGCGVLRVERVPACCGRCARAPDHIVSELERMACLIEQTGGAEAPGNWLRRLHCWIPRFLHALRGAEPPPAPLYGLAADFLEQLLEWDRRYLLGADDFPGAKARHSCRNETPKHC